MNFITIIIMVRQPFCWASSVYTVCETPASLRTSLLAHWTADSTTRLTCARSVLQRAKTFRAQQRAPTIIGRSSAFVCLRRAQVFRNIKPTSPPAGSTTVPTPVAQVLYIVASCWCVGSVVCLHTPLTFVDSVVI